jgi:hypothetical protein
MFHWRSPGWRERLLWGGVVVGLAVALGVLTGFGLLAVLIVAAGVAVAPGDEPVFSRVVVPAIILGAFVIARIAA